MPLPFSSPSSLTLSPPPPPLLARRSGFSLSISGEGEEKKGRRWVVLINGRKPDDGKGRRETDRPHNLPTYLPGYRNHFSLSLSIFFSLTSVFLSVTHTHTHTLLKHSPDTTHTNTHLTANMLQKTHSNTQLWTLICQHTHTQHCRLHAQPPL